MREDLLKELEEEFAERRRLNEKEENRRKDLIRTRYPDIDKSVKERESLVLGTLRRILEGNAKPENLEAIMMEINQRIETMLLENHLPADFLAPVYHCKVCRDTGYKGDPIRMPCNCLKNAYQKKLRDSIGLDPNGNETFEKYNESLIPDDPVEGIGISQRQITGFAKEQCEKWADSFPDVAQRDILLTGESGLGKTFLMRATACRLIEKGHNVLIVSAYTFLQEARKSYFGDGEGIHDLYEVPVLMLDDLGSEPMMQNITVEQLFNLINERQAKGLSTVLSTNLRLDELRNRYTERIVSRLNNPKRCLILTLAGKDLRKLGG